MKHMILIQLMIGINQSINKINIVLIACNIDNILTFLDAGKISPVPNVVCVTTEKYNLSKKVANSHGISHRGIITSAFWR